MQYLGAPELRRRKCGQIPGIPRSEPDGSWKVGSRSESRFPGRVLVLDGNARPGCLGAGLEESKSLQWCRATDRGEPSHFPVRVSEKIHVPKCGTCTIPHASSLPRTWASALPLQKIFWISLFPPRSSPLLVKEPHRRNISVIGFPFSLS